MANITAELREGTVVTLHARQFTWKGDEPLVPAGPTKAQRLMSSCSDWRRLQPGEIASGDPNAPSRAVRELLCEQIAERLGVAISELEVRRQGRVPFLFVSGQPARVDLSLSHHGDWLGFACELEPAVPGALVR